MQYSESGNETYPFAAGIVALESQEEVSFLEQLLAQHRTALENRLHDRAVKLLALPNRDQLPMGAAAGSLDPAEYQRTLSQLGKVNDWLDQLTGEDHGTGYEGPSDRHTNVVDEVWDRLHDAESGIEGLKEAYANLNDNVTALESVKQAVRVLQMQRAQDQNRLATILDTVCKLWEAEDTSNGRHSVVNDASRHPLWLPGTLHEHDGLMPHSHEVRQDHDGIKIKV